MHLGFYSCRSVFAKVGARAALRLALGVARRAWKGGEAREECAALLREALAAVKALPTLALYSAIPPSDDLWPELVDAAVDFLHQLISGYF